MWRLSVTACIATTRREALAEGPTSHGKCAEAADDNALKCYLTHPPPANFPRPVAHHQSIYNLPLELQLGCVPTCWKWGSLISITTRERSDDKGKNVAGRLPNKLSSRGAVNSHHTWQASSRNFNTLPLKVRRRICGRKSPKVRWMEEARHLEAGSCLWCTGSSTAAATSFWGSPDLGMALVGFSSA